MPEPTEKPKEEESKDRPRDESGHVIHVHIDPAPLAEAVSTGFSKAVETLRPPVGGTAKLPSGEETPDGSTLPTGKALEAQRRKRWETLFRGYFLQSRGLTDVQKAIEQVTDTSSADAQGQIWLPDIFSRPVGLKIDLREFTDFQEIPRGADRVHWIRITKPTWADGTPGTSPTIQNPTITKVTATPTERVSGHGVDFNVLEDVNPTLVAKLEEDVVFTAVRDQFKKLIDVINAEAVGNLAGTAFPGTVTAESSLASGDTLNPDVLSKADKLLKDKGFDTSPDSVIYLVNTKQWQDLVTNADFKQAERFGARPVQEGTVLSWLGHPLIVADQMPTGTGSGSPAITTYRGFAIVVTPRVMGGASSRSLLMETDRNTRERRLYLTSSYRDAYVLIEPQGIARFISA